MGSNKRSDEKSLHIVSARRKEDGDCIGRKTAEVRAEDLLLRRRIVHTFGVGEVGSCKSVKHRLHFSEVECSHGKGGDLRSKYSPDLDCENPLTMCAGCPAQWDGQPCLPHNAIVSFQNLIRRMHS